MIPLLLLPAALSARPSWEPQSGVTEGYNIAIMAITDSRPEDALALLEPVLAADPGCGLCQTAQAIALLRADRPGAALDVLDALATVHDRVEVHTLRAVAAAAIGEHETSRNAALRAANQDPSAVAAQRALLGAMLTLGEHEEAQRVLQLAHRHLAQPEAACLGVEYALAVDNLPGARGAMSLCRSAADPRLLQELELKLARAEGDLDAIARHAEALGLDALRDKARAAGLLQAGEIDAAVALLDAVLTDRADDSDALLLRALCSQARGATNDALLDLDRLKAHTDAPRLLPDGSLRQLHDQRTLLAQAGALRIMLLLDDGRAEDARIILDRQGVNDITAAAHARLLLVEAGAEVAAAELERLARQWPDAPQLPQVALQIAQTVPPSPALIGWIQSLREPQHAWRMAAIQHQRGANDSCLALLAPLSSSSALSLAWRCAVSADATDEADRLLAALQAAALPLEVEVLLRHAWLLGQSGAPDRGLTLLDGVIADEPTATALRGLQVTLAADAGDLSAALAVAAAGPIDPTHRTHLAGALYDAGHPRQAAEQLRIACPALSDADRRTCQSALTQLKEAP